jgi:hypothetical protein
MGISDGHSTAGAMSVDTELGHNELRLIAARYAAGVDRRDKTLFLSAFANDAVMMMPPSSDGGAHLALHGHHEIGSVIELIARYPSTFHFVGQACYEFGDTESNGEVYCIAHHITPERDRDLVMYIRYHDIYRREGSSKAWLIGRRLVHVDWTETRPLRFPKGDQP